MDKKTEKKISRLTMRLAEYESVLLLSLTKKDHKIFEVDVPELTSRIKQLKEEIATLKKE